MDRLLLLMPKTTYRADDFVEAADAVGVQVTLGTDRCRTLDAKGVVRLTRPNLALRFDDLQAATRTIVEAGPFSAVIPTDDPTTELATYAAAALGLPHNDIEGVRACRDKLGMRRRLAAAGVPQPAFQMFDPVDRCRIDFPIVAKPRRLSASRGVVRADDPEELRAAVERITKLLGDPTVAKRTGDATGVLLESFVPGVEVAVEGLVTEGELQVLAVFDKPDPMDGPFFEETIYVTPSRLDVATLVAVRETTSAAVAALGIRHGPVHAELRIGQRGPCVIEVAPRAIGGLCARTLRFGVGMSLEAVIIRHALGHPIERIDAHAAGVLMIPIPRSGMLRGVHGLDEARRIDGVEDIVITANIDREIVALPEGDAYLGFAFARGATPDEVETTLREVQDRLDVDVAAKLPIAYTSPN